MTKIQSKNIALTETKKTAIKLSFQLVSDSISFSTN